MSINNCRGRAHRQDNELAEGIRTRHGLEDVDGALGSISCHPWHEEVEGE